MKLKTFRETLSTNVEDIKDLRLDRANLDAAAASSVFIKKLKQNFRKAQSEFEEYLDLNDDNTNDIAKVLKNFNAETWVNNIYKKSLEIVNKAIAIRCAVKLHNSLFPDELETGLTEYEKELVDCLTDKDNNEITK